MRTILLTLLLLTNLSIAEAKTKGLKTGVWETQTVLFLNGWPIPATPKRDCLTREVARDVRGWLQEALGKNGCELTEWKLKNGHLISALACSNDEFEAEGLIEGSVQAKEFKLSGNAEGIWNNKPAKASVVMVGRWIAGRCPPKK